MTTLIDGLTWCFVEIKIHSWKCARGIYPTVICVTFQT
jgi:hypothetical protein